MSPPDLRTVVRDTILELIDLDLWNHARAIEKVEVESMHDFHKSWQATISGKATQP
jgi:hypothetical protein